MDSICLVGNSLRPMAGLDSVYGYDIASSDALNAIIQYGNFQKIQIMAEPNQFQEQVMLRKINSLRRECLLESEIEMISEYDILYGKKPLPGINVMHNVGSEFISPLHYRCSDPQGAYPFTYTIHGASYPYYISSFYLMKLLMPFRPYDSLICTSHAVKKAVEKIIDCLSETLERDQGIDLSCRCRMDVIPLGVDTNKFKPQDKKVLRKKLNIPQDYFVMLWVGRFSAYDKANLMPLITVYKRLISKRPNQKILMVLAGHDHKNSPIIPQLQKYISDLGLLNKIVLMSEHNLKNRHELIALADVFISPADNIQETFGITPIEAMACGIPQIVSDWDGYKETVVDGVTGFRIPTYWMECDEDIQNSITFPSDPMRRSAIHHMLQSQSVAIDLNLLESRILLLLDHPELRLQLGLNSRRIACAKFEWQTIVKQYKNLWEELSEYSHKDTTFQYGKSDFLNLPYHYAFSHYSTRDLTEDEVIRITTQGKLLHAGKWPRPLCYDVELLLLEYNCFLEVLNLLNCNTNGISIRNIQKNLMPQYSLPVVRRAVLYAIKHGFADIH